MFKFTANKRVRNVSISLCLGIVFALANCSPVQAVDGLMNGKFLTGETDDFILWLQSYDQTTSPYYNDLFFLNKAGNLGIGIPAPTKKLDVAGDLLVRNAATFSSSITLSSMINSGNRILMVGNDGVLYSTSSSIATGLPSPSGISGQTLRSNGTSWVANNLLYNNGTNVGIGTAAPSQKLDVQGNIAIANNMIGGGKNYGNSGNSASAYLQLYDNSTGRTTLNNQVYAIDFQTATTSRLFITNGGNVGIGITNPGAKLQVEGGNIFVNKQFAQVILGAQGSDGDVHIGSSGMGAPVNGTQDYGFYNAYNAYRADDGNWYHSRTNTVGAYKFSGGYHQGGFTWSYVANQGAAALVWTDLMKLTTAGNVGIGTTTPNRRLDLGGGTDGRIYGIDIATNAIFTDSEVVPKKWIVDNFAPATAKTYEYNFGGYYNANTPEYIGTILTYGNGSSGTFSFEFSTPGEANMTAGIVNVSNAGGSAVPYVRVISSDRSNAQILAKRRSDPAVIDFYYTSPQTIGYTPRFKVYNTSSYQSSAPTTPASWDFTFNLNTLYARNIITDGNVGIGTTAPAKKLDIAYDGLGVGFGGNTLHNVGAPATGTDAANVNYVNSVIAPAATTTVGLQSGFWTTGAGSSIYNNNTGNVGIGTTNPGAKLALAGETTFTYPTMGIGTGVIHLNAPMTAGNTTAITFGGAGTSNLGQAGIYVQSSGGYGTKMYFGTTESYATGAQARMMIDHVGNVGIGTTTPGAKLDVNGLAYFRQSVNFYSPQSDQLDRRLTINTNNAGLTTIYNYDEGDTAMYPIQIGSNTAGTGLTVLGSGNVGIGTTTPGSLLDLAGNLKITSGGIVYNTNSGYRFNFSDIFGDNNSLTVQGDLNSAGVLETTGTARPNYVMGNLGVGTSNPGYKLQVDGTIFANNNNAVLVGTAAGSRAVYSNNYNYYSPVSYNGHSWFYNSSNSWTFQGGTSGEDWTQTAQLFLNPLGTTGADDKLIELGQRVSNTAAGSYKGLRIVHYSGGTIKDGYLQAGDANFSGTLTAGTISATGLTGTVNASNVTPGAFNSTLGTGGNYSFPASVGIGTTNPSGILSLTKFLSLNDNQEMLSISHDSAYNLKLYQNFSAGGVMQYNWVQKIAGVDNNVLTFRQGNVGIGTTTPGAFRLKVAGDAAITGILQTMTGSDFAEEFTVASPLESGTVVVMGDLGYKSVKACNEEFDSTVVGVVSDNPSIIAGRVDSKHKAVVAMAGVVKVKVSNTNGNIKKGTMLTTSEISGYAMKADSAHPGTIIGKALESLSGSRGEIKVLINLQ